MPEEVDLPGLREVIAGPLHDIAGRFSRFLADRWPHRALVIFTRECTGRPRKVAGESETIGKVTIAELEHLKARVEPGRPLSTTAVLSGAIRPAWVLQDPIGTLLVLVPRSLRARFPDPAELADVFGVVATSIRQQVAQASPDYLAESRAASSERARTIAEMAAAQERTLVTMLTALRSTKLDDHRARLAATESASTALLALRSAQQADLAVSEEPAQAAFARLRREVRQLLRHHDAELEFAAPAKDVRPLAGEVAYAARAMTSTAVLAFMAQPTLKRLRIAWSCDDSALRLDIRDHGPGPLDAAALHLQLDGRAKTLRAAVDIDSVPGWGSRVTIGLPLDPPPDRSEATLLANLNRRELEVLQLVAQGQRNRTIAEALGITESTVKFHVAGVLKKLEVTSRGEASALALTAGITAPRRAAD
ncbi:LuxR C-terminal-related transcriptional regulator [Amycolatopsis rhabdoformis]|uniref:LuxR C-terminal-related transcriptional regulator n=1 Tax=Amycolatopsis rhabdoformis TaxID=1448059 RepID=A0ABZ1ILZ2_9PSEU|nr:LuxR C-terminal-related transcriptional regulator [Amycolatopsis rhabdoformis]WSE34742.1 LuxR C-terminal-related transcriptional regulator [Amycolatopsis rhabdoformis]